MGQEDVTLRIRKIIDESQRRVDDAIERFRAGRPCGCGMLIGCPLPPATYVDMDGIRHMVGYCVDMATGDAVEVDR